MPKFYSQDFRQKVIEAIELNGHKKGEASELFNISRNIIDLWLKLKAQTGSLQPKSNQSPGSNHKITDWEKFREFAQANGDKTQKQMAQLWDGEISDRTISRALHKIGFTRKKRPMATKNGTKPSVQNFWSRRSTLKPEDIVYADEAGMDRRDDYGYGWNEEGKRFYVLKSGRRQGRVNMIAAYCNHQLMAPFTVEGACNRNVARSGTQLTCSLQL